MNEPIDLLDWYDPLDCKTHGWKAYGIFGVCPDCSIQAEEYGERIADQLAEEEARELRAQWQVIK